MKSLLKPLMAVAILGGTFMSTLDGVSAQQIAPYSTYGAGTTNGATALSWAISSAHSFNDGVPVVTYLSAVSDKAASKVQFYLCTAMATCTATNSTTTLSVNQTNGFASGDVVVIEHINNDRYEKRILTTMTGSTNLVTTVGPMQPVIPGDVIYRMTTAGAPIIPCITNTYTAANSGLSLNLSGPAITTGSWLNGTCPILAEVDGTASATLNAMTVTYTPVR